MKKLILPIVFILLSITTPVSVFAQYPANCWDIMQDNTCLRNVTECNIECGGTSDQAKVKACLASCDKTYTSCSDERTANYKACVNAQRKASDAQEAKQLQPSKEPANDKVLTCEEVKDIIEKEGTEDCQNPIVDPARGGVWCNLPLSKTTTEQYHNLYAPKYTFPPGTCNDVLENNPQDQKPDSAQKNNQDNKDEERKETAREWFNRVFGPILNNSDTPQVEKIPAEKINDWIKDTFGDSNIADITTGPELDRLPSTDKQPEVTVEKPIPESPFSAGILKKEGGSHATIQYPGSKTFTEMKPGKIPPGSIIRPGDDHVYFYFGDGRFDKFIIGPGAQWKTPEFIVPEVGTEPGTWHLNKGTVEVKKEQTSQSSPQPGGSTEFADIFVIGTHYWVTHEPGKQTVVGVYEGQVEIRTKDGKTTTVSPDSDKPGVVVVSQKLSPVKLGILGLAVAVVTGGAILILRRKFDPAGFSKKKR